MLAGKWVSKLTESNGARFDTYNLPNYDLLLQDGPVDHGF